MDQILLRQRGNLDLTDPDYPVIESKNYGEQWSLDPTGNWEAFQQDTDGDWDLDQSRSHDTANEITQIDSSSTHVAPPSP